MIEKKDYTGLKVIEHVVQPGESLSRIATYYFGKPHWQALATYNTSVRPVLKSAAKDDLKQLPAGKRILIPRSAAGYDRWEKQLLAILGGVEGFSITEYANLERIENEAGASYELWDLSGDVLTLFGSLAYKGASAAKTAYVAYAKDTADDGLAVALRVCGQEVDKYMFAIDEAVDAAVSAARKAMQKTANIKLLDKSLGLIFEEPTAKSLVALRKILDASKGARGGSAKLKLEAGKDITRALAEAADLFKVSTFNRFLLILLYGETVEQSIDSQRQRLEATLTAQRKALGERIAAVKAERKLVWG